MILTKTFAESVYTDALESWAWLDLRDRTPVLTNLFGDVFLVAHDGYWFLDTLEGTLTREWVDRDALVAALDTEEGQDRYLLGALAMAADRQGRTLTEQQVYDWTVPPVLGGPIEVDNMTVLDLSVRLHIAGQLHEQVRDLPPGTSVDGFRIE